METPAAPALPIISGTASGDTFSGPFSISTSLPCSSVPMPPMPVPMTHPLRLAGYGFVPVQPPPARAPPARARPGHVLVGGDQRDLGEAVRPARPLDRQVIGGVELARAADPVLDPRLAGA